ncbi:hypothetical protein JCM10450v2_007922 [Rhodotorula kratochvilovae]
MHGAPTTQRVRLARPSLSLVPLAIAFVVGIFAQGAHAAASLPLSAVNTMFLFGDSYTQNGYNVSLGYNVSSQPLSSSSVWPDYLVRSPAAPAALRSSYYNFGKGGATIGADRELVGYPNVSLADQVDTFERYFVGADVSEGGVAEERPVWDGNSTLFSVWFGINDIEITWKRGEEFPSRLESTFGELQDGVDRLYALGARHFLIPLLPPYHRAPLMTRVYADLPGVNDTFYDDFVAWNDRMRRFVSELAAQKEDASVTLWDTWGEFERILDSPAEYGFVNTTNWCDSYSSFLWALDPPADLSDVDSCGAPMSGYVWFDRSHPTTAVHKLIASGVEQALSPSSPISRRAATLPIRFPLSAPTHRASVGHARFTRLVRTGGLARREREAFWKELRGTAVGSVVAGARVGQ